MVTEVGSYDFDELESNFKTLRTEYPIGFFDRFTDLFNWLFGSGSTYCPIALQFDKEEEIAKLNALCESLQNSPETRLYCERTIRAFNEEIKKIDLSTTTSAKEKIQDKIHAAEEARKKVGTLRFVSELAPAKAKTALQASDQTEALKGLRDRLMGHYKDVLKKTAISMATVGIQDPELFLSYALPREIGKMLLGSSGKINFELLAIILKRFAPENGDLSEWEGWMQSILQQIDPSWQAEIDLITAPAEGTIGNQLIRAELGLPRATMVTDLHSKQVVLGALLSKFVPSAPYVNARLAWEIKRQGDSPLRALKDYASLVSNGSLTRSGQTFSYNLVLNDPNLDNLISRDPDGRISGTSLFLWDDPGIRAGLRQIGIEKPTLYAQQALSSLLAQTSAREVLQAFARAVFVDVNPALIGFRITDNRLLEANLEALTDFAQ